MYRVQKFSALLNLKDSLLTDFRCSQTDHLLRRERMLPCIFYLPVSVQEYTVQVHSGHIPAVPAVSSTLQYSPFPVCHKSPNLPASLYYFLQQFTPFISMVRIFHEYHMSGNSFFVLRISSSRLIFPFVRRTLFTASFLILLSSFSFTWNLSTVSAISISTSTA